MSKYFPNPVGRPKSSAWVKHLAGKYTEEALLGIVDIARDADAPAGVRLNAWTAVLDRAHGKPAQEVTGNLSVTKNPDDLYAEIAAAVAEAGVDPDAGPTGESH